MIDRDDITRQLTAFICRELLNNPGYALAADQPLITGGIIDSFSLVQVGVFIESAFGVYIPDTDLTVENLDTINQMVDRVVRELKRS